MIYQVIRAKLPDAEEILELQKLAYQIEAKRYNNYEISPLKQTVEEIRAQFQDHIFLKAVADQKIIGTVRAYTKNGTCYIGKLAVHPQMQNQGVGTSLMKQIEAMCFARRFELFVGSESVNNIHLYQKLGYQIFKREKYESGDIEILFMEKKVTV